MSVDLYDIVLGTPDLRAGSGAGDSTDAAAAWLLVAGDLCVRAGTPLAGPQGSVPWAPLAAEIGDHALALVNLECPLGDRGQAILKSGPVLCGDLALAQTIATGGFHGVTLANNHILDVGPTGVRDTLDACRRAGLLTVGAGPDLASAQAPLFVAAGGLRVGVVACAEREFSIARADAAGAAPLDPWTTPRLVSEAAQHADVVVVIVHGGNEFASIPRPGLVAACHALVHAGAGAVICHHSHVPGPAEVYDGAPIFYGTGNFLFPDDEVTDPAWNEGYAVSLELTAAGVRAAGIIPYEHSLRGLVVSHLDAARESELVARLLRGGAIVADPDMLAAAWDAHCASQRRHYLYMALGLTRVERRLLRYGGWPAWRWPRRRLSELLDVITCDSHREALECILDKERSS